MPDLPQFIGILDAIILPLIGCCTLVLSKISQGEAARWAERQFLAALVVITIVTIRTVITCDDAWLVHTTTLATMIVGVLLVPNQDASVAL